MSDQTKGRDRLAKASAGGGASRRGFLQSGAGLAAGGLVAQLLPQGTLAQPVATDADGELARVQGQRRVLLEGGVALTLDRRVGDFAQADVLIEDGKIREVGPSIAVSGESVAIVDAANRIVLPGFIDTHH